jgi:uncharacterized membrane protein YkoI
MLKAVVTRGAAVAALAGSLALTNGCALMGGRHADRAISMGELPAVVRGAAEKETSGCRIIEVEQETKGEKLIYAITYDQAGTEMEIEYSPDGTLLSKGKE